MKNIMNPIVRQTILTFLFATGLASVMAQTASIDNYQKPPIYSFSSDFTVVANGKNIDVIKFQDYDYVHFSMGSGTCTFDVTALGMSSISSYSISPLNLNIAGTVTGNLLSFTIPRDMYMIVWISDKRRLVIAADPAETDKPASSGTGTFNIRQAPYNADATGATLMTTAIQNAVNAASAYGTANGTRGIVYVPSGVYKMGNLQLKSNLSLYLEKGAVLRFSDNPSDYTVNFVKNVNGTWWIYTQDGAANIKMYGRGTVDGNGYYMQRTAGFVNHLLVPLQCSNFTLDGLVMLNAACWGTVVARSHNITIRNTKHFNSLNLGENDGIDVCESQNVLVQHSIGIGHDDPYSTKTWDERGELPKNWYGTPEDLRDVVFDDCVSWTGCVGFKVGAGVRGDQENITFKNSAIYDCARGLAIDYSYGNHRVNNVTFDNIYIQNVDKTCGLGPQWLELFVKNLDGDGGGPVTNIIVKNITLREKGGAASMIKGYSSSASINGVTLENIYVQGNSRPAATLQEMKITDVNSFASNISILPRQAPSTRIQAEYYADQTGIALGEAADEGGGNFISTKNVSYIVYKDVDFGAETKSIDVRLATTNSGGTIEFRLGSSQGTLLGTLNVTSSGSWTTYKTMNLPVSNAKGVQTLYMIARKADALTIANINWFELHRTDVYATTYGDCNFTGTKAELGPDEYTQTKLLAKGISDNSVSSLTIRPGCVAIGWENDNFQGAALSMESDQSCLVSNGFNDRISSMKVRIASVTTITGTHRLRNRYSGMYMDVTGASPNEGALIDQWPGNGQTNQQFTFGYLGSGVYRITAVNSGRALEVSQGLLTEGAKLIQATYAARASQQFYLQPTGDGYYRLIAKHSYKLIEVKDLSKREGTVLQQWTQGDQLAGQWELIPLTGGRLPVMAHEIFETGEEEFALYPNPARDRLQVKLPADMQGGALVIYDAKGDEVIAIGKFQGDPVDISFLKNGLYTVHVAATGVRRIRRFIKK